MKSCFQDNHIYSTDNKGLSIVAKIFIKTLKNKIYKYMIQYQNICILIS